MADFLPKAYPEALRTEIGKKVRLLSEAVSGSEWKNHTTALAETDVFFATWGMPELDAEFLDATPRLKAVFYAAGSVKDFATPESYKRDILISSSWQANAIPVAEYSNAIILLGLKGFWSSQRLARGEIARMGYWMKDELDLYLPHKPLQHGVTKDTLARMA